MKRILSLIAVYLLAVLGNCAFAQKKSTDDYNLKKAYEVLREKNDEDEAMKLINKQLELTPDNVEALLLRMRIYRNQDEYGKALADINHAIKVNKPKKSDVENSTLYWWKGYVYQDLLDREKAAEAFKTAYQLAQKDNKEHVSSIAFDYAQALYYLNDLTGSDRIYRNLLADDETDASAMVGLARNMFDRGQLDDAEKMLLSAIKMDENYPSSYRFLLQVYDKKGDVNKAIDAAIDYMAKDSDARWKMFVEVAKKNLNYAVARVSGKLKDSDNPLYWRALLCELYESTGKYELALKEISKLEQETGKDPDLHAHKAEYFRHLGMPESAILELDQVLAEGGDWNAYCERGICYRLMGDFEKAIEDFTSAIEEDPRYAYPYYARGWCYELLGKDNLALEEYNLGIDIDSDYPYIFLERGLILKKMGRNNEALSDFETVIAKDTVAVDGSCTHYALHELGQDDKALAWMRKIIDDEPSNAGNWYDYACLYGRMNRIEEALQALEKAFEYGYRNFKHLEYDDDMDVLRELPQYKELVRKYEAIHEEFLKQADIPVAEATESTISEVAFTRHAGGTFEVPCQINGLTLQMIFDTGASDVTISSVEANFMLKNRYLSEKDVKGKRSYQVATGELSTGTVITLREVMIGDVLLKNVEASVVGNQRAPLLFGQSAMERFGTITIDNDNNKLIIKH